MNDRVREELAAWLEFFRDLGIEDFYRRSPGEIPSELLPSPESRQAMAPAESEDALRTAVPVPPNPLTRPPKPLPQQAGPHEKSVAALQVAIPLPAPALSLFDAPHAPRAGPETLDQIQADLGDCHRCKLARGRKTIVFGEGNPHAQLVFVGEGPGADEDEQGRPFVGRAGQLLNRMIQWIGMKREDVYICNVVKCRPPGNRTPEKDEIETCSTFLFRQLEAIKPRLICCLGAPAAKTVLGIKEGITKIRGQFYGFGQSKAMATVHPAYVLRNPREERILREDFEKIREFLRRA
jgi:uracil-DNA glycosylase family 4